MTWSAPMTAVAGSVFTAAQFNTFVRDNLNECPAAKATTPGSIFVTSATNQVAERITSANSDLTSATTAQTSYADPDTGAAGPAVTVTTGANALVVVSSSLANSGTGSVRAAYEVTGSSAIAAADNRGVGAIGSGVTVLAGNTVWHGDLTPGSNTFTMKYRVSASTGTYGSRRIFVIPF